MAAGRHEATEVFREPGTTHLSPRIFAQVMELDLSELAEALGVHRNTMRLHPYGSRTQERLREYNRVFQSLAHDKAEIVDVVFHMKNTPIRVLGGRSLFEAIRDGDTEKALRYLQTVSGGQNG